MTPYVQDRGIVCCPLLPSVPWQREALDKLQILLDTDREDALALVIRLLELWQVLETGFLRPAHPGPSPKPPAPAGAGRWPSSSTITSTKS